ncbi:o-succinylbenzoate synthase [Galactobacter caseinivorans]|uniref:o-succinylbenzoate synthase n=1 Tax=Galactobacter caseinivorans TaxID=2676123 RepID=A0A496PLQ5_9MICC|nr:o-succinylbenzoate synthase [Galactobacter caseinivorans]RKW71396.1 O-succinylbenzoate synthase [Galactobacter caseinivorans]
MSLLPLQSPTLPSVEELQERAHVVCLPLHVRFRGVVERQAVLLDGPQGWSEFSPFLEYADAEAARWLACAVEAGWEGLPAPVRTAVPVNATVPAIPASDVEQLLARYDAPGTVKVKVAEAGQTLADDVARLAAVRAVLPQARLRIDANQSWGHREALVALEALAPFGLEYAEQPVPGIEGLARLREELARRGLPVLIAADESVRKESDPLAVAQAGAADLIVVKAQPLGGVRRALEIVRQAGLPAVVSSALDTSVGLRVGAGLAAALPQLPYACGLGTGSLFVSDVVEPGYVASGGELDLRTVAADPALLARHAASAERREWWMARLSRAHAVLAAQAR